MSIHLRSVLEDNGDTVDLAWYCSRSCYAASLDDEPPSDTFEAGGRYPCGEESDTPDFCATCGQPVGNPLTDYGYAYARELAADWHGDPAVRDALVRKYSLDEGDDDA